MNIILLPWLLVLLAISATLGMAWRCTRLVRCIAEARSICASAREEESRVTRCLQLFAHDLQSLALTLRGHADQLSAEGHGHAPAMAVVTAQLGGLADELGHHLIPPGVPRVLECAAISLTLLIHEAVEAISAGISPGRRHWRVGAGTPEDAAVWGDPRALRLVLVRVMGEAVRSSGHDDWIDIDWSTGPGGLYIRIEDEGTGTIIPGAPGALMDSRGIGLRLSLARTLIQAHGGTLEIEALARIGTRVTIELPINRLRINPTLALVNHTPHAIASEPAYWRMA